MAKKPDSKRKRRPRVTAVLPLLLHHQSEDAEIAVAVVVPPVVAVETLLVEVAEVEQVAVGIPGRSMPRTVKITAL